MAFEFDNEWLEKVQAMREAGRDPYPNGFHVTHTSTELHSKYLAASKEELEELALEVEVAGRVRFRNRMGKLLFLRVQDRGEAVVEDVDQDGEPTMRGGIIQVMVRKNAVGDEPFDEVKSLDIGDFVWVKGLLTRTRTGELTVNASQTAFAGKIMQAFPDRFHGLGDVETRSRMRYVDLFMNDETRKTFRMRSKIIRYLRDYFHDRDFIEVETPMMQPIPGGANARPFVTHHNALDMQLYLRVAPELYLKRLVVGGFDRVFEINRNFRNEGISVKHNPEFTMLEFYQAWSTYADLMDLTEELIQSMVVELVGSEEITFNGHDMNFARPWRRADMDELIVEHTDLEMDDMEDCDKMRAYWVERHGESDNLPTVRGKWWEVYFDEYVEKRLSSPTFVTGYPTEISPLSRRNNEDPTRVDRFELFAAGWEIANAFSELNDPVDQSQRFLDQVAAKDAGDDESMYYDEDYIRALSYGMPPTAGEGIGIDRLVMLLTGKPSIREVILFPTLRPETQS